MPTRVLLADAQTIFRDAIRTLIELRDDLEVVAEAGDGATALELIGETKPDISLLEAALPRLSGIEVARRLVRAGCKSRFLLLSGQVGAAHLRQALTAGAVGFVYKTDPSSRLLEAIDALGSGRRYVSPAASQHLVDLVATGDNDAAAGGSLLTTREREVLQLVAEGFSSKEVAAALGISTRTVESHRGRVMDKLGIHKVSGLVRYAIREGLLNP